jgi:hypothetical protein
VANYMNVESVGGTGRCMACPNPLAAAHSGAIDTNWYNDESGGIGFAVGGAFAAQLPPGRTGAGAAELTKRAVWHAHEGCELPDRPPRLPPPSLLLDRRDGSDGVVEPPQMLT